jgi:hypothetical protein
MRRAIQHPTTRGQRGIAAVELALTLPVLVMLLAVPLFFGRVFWHYTVAQKAAHDAVRYFATVPLTQMRNPNQVGYSVEVAHAIATEVMADLNPGPYPPDITVSCDGFNCVGFSIPTMVKVGVQISMHDEIFPFVTGSFMGEFGLPLRAEVTMQYAGE